MERKLMSIKMINAELAKEWIEAGEAILIDVREQSEYDAQNIPSAHLAPLGALSCADLPSVDGKIIIHCQKGMRGNKACEKLLAENSGLEIYNLEGGIESWSAAGFKTHDAD